MQPHEIFALINQKIRSKHSRNNFSPLEAFQISASTLRRYIKEMKLIEVQNADTKSEARQQAHCDLRNFMALCAVLDVLFKVTSEEHIYSSDDVSVLLNGWKDKPTVLTSKEMKDYLHAQHIGVSTTEPAQKRHVITYSVTVGGTGDVPCIVAKIVNKEFPAEMKEKPRIYDVGGNMFVMLIHGDTDDKIVTSAQYRSCIIPRCQEARKAALLRDLESAACAPSQSSVGSVGKDVERIRQDHRFMALLCDGAQPQIAAILEELNAAFSGGDSTSPDTLFAKYSAACSMSQQVNDVGYMHATLHGQFKSVSFRYGEDFSDPKGHAWSLVKRKLEKYLPEASFRAYWKCLCHTGDFMGKAFTGMTVKSAYRLAGVVPFNKGFILSRCPCFPDLTQDAAQHIVDSIPGLADQCEEHGIVPEPALAAVLAGHPGCPQYAPKTKGKPLNEMVTNRQRAMVMSNDNYLSVLAARRELSAPRTAAAGTGSSAAAGSADPTSGQGPSGSSKQTHVACRGPNCTERCEKTAWEECGWEKCGFPYCRQYFCPKVECRTARTTHRADCKQAKRVESGTGPVMG